MPERLLIIMMNTDPTHIAEVSAPLFQATVAASMEFGVEIILTGRAGELAKTGFASSCRLREGSEDTVYDLIREAHEAGVLFKVCTPSVEGWSGDLIPEIHETIGSAYLISEAMTEDTVTFTY